MHSSCSWLLPCFANNKVEQSSDSGSNTILIRSKPKLTVLRINDSEHTASSGLSCMGSVGSVLPEPSDPSNLQNRLTEKSEASRQVNGEKSTDSKNMSESSKDDNPEEFNGLLKQIAASKSTIVSTDDNFSEYVAIIKGNSETEVPINTVKVSHSTKQKLQELTLMNKWPLVFIKGNAVGNMDDLKHIASSGILNEWLKDHKYDLVVVGGGSGGLAAAKEAARLGKKVACLDFVKPSPIGTTWGLGGTCVNVGCIPKKLMHQASLLGHSIKDAKMFGWKLPDGEVTHNWTNMKNSIQDYIASLNWGYRVQLREKKVDYVNGYGVFTKPFEISATNKRGKVELLTADRFLIATGLRPKYPDVPGAKEFTITSDDLFSLPYAPGKTLCVGASYVSLECAGFLHGVGFDVTVMVRSILLRGFDQDMAERIRKHMIEYGVKFESGVPSRFEQVEPKTDGKPGLVKVFWDKKAEDGSKIEVSETYNTVVIAIGREGVTRDMGLDKINVDLNSSGKVIGRREQSRSCPFVYAVGDVLQDTPELTPVAIHAGKVLMRRLFLGSDELTEYDKIPTTVFTPLEYGCCGWSEEDAIARLGKDNVIIYHAVFNPLEYTVAERMDKEHCYCKLICHKGDQERVLGFHILTPWAGEVTQGFGIALKFGAKKRDFDSLIGIHPTVAENFTTLTLVKKDGDEELKASGC